MPGQDKLQSTTFLAAVDMSSAQYKFAHIHDADGEEVDIAGAGETIIGVIQNNPAVAGYPVEIMIAGISKLVAGAAINAGELLKSDGNGDAIPVAADREQYGAVALEDAADNDIFMALVTPMRQTSQA